MSQSVRLISRTREIIRSLNHKFTQKCMFIERFCTEKFVYVKIFLYLCSRKAANASATSTDGVKSVTY